MKENSVSGFTPTENHASTLALLEEVRNFLTRYQFGPSEREICSRIDQHIAAPEQARVKDTSMRALHEVAKRRLIGGTYSAVGLAIIEAELFDSQLTLKAPNLDTPHVDFDEAWLLKLLRNGVTLKMLVKK